MGGGTSSSLFVSFSTVGVNGGVGGAGGGIDGFLICLTFSEVSTIIGGITGGATPTSSSLFSLVLFPLLLC